MNLRNQSSIRWTFGLMLLSAMVVQSSVANVRLCSIFSDGLVLQQNKPVPIWGWAEAGEKIMISFAGQELATTADDDGNWKIALNAIKASDKPQTLTVRGTNTLTVKDVLVGEVWLFSGQSNMALVMSAIANEPRGLDKASAARVTSDIQAANDPLLREYRVEIRAADRARQDTSSRRGWMTWNSQVGGEWSAFAAYFGQRMREKLHVPIGIVMCSWGGSGASSWISAQTLQGPKLRSLWPEDVIGWRANILPSRLYNGMLQPLAPFAIKGFGWYQGETEATPYHNPFIYRYLLSGLIEDWRHLWRDKELPFYIVQLPNRNNEPRWVIVRESQSVAARLPHTGLMPTIDIGQPGDLHPKNKYDAGFRFADLILAKEYGQRTWSGAPSFDKIERKNGALRLSFKDAEQGLKTKDDKPPLGFMIAGEDRVFKPAEAKIEGSSVVLSASGAPGPVAARYAWESAPTLNLTGAGGLPVIPFRTDDWPVEGQEMVGQASPVKEQLATVTTGAQLALNEAKAWQPSKYASELGGPDSLFFKTNPRGGANILVRGRALRKNLPISPAFFWTCQPEVDPSKGLTVEFAGSVGRVGNYQRGFDIEIGLPQPDKKTRRYLVTIFPSRVHTFQADELRVLRSDMEEGAAVYRVAVRADGVAQIYHNADLLGTTVGELIDADPELAKVYVRIGKTISTGEWLANISHVAIDTSGAFMPPPSMHTSSDEPMKETND